MGQAPRSLYIHDLSAEEFKAVKAAFRCTSLSGVPVKRRLAVLLRRGAKAALAAVRKAETDKALRERARIEAAQAAIEEAQRKAKRAVAARDRRARAKAIADAERARIDAEANEAIDALDDE
tara:strand:- start:6292 stop:6657 length:366 start_codon:yes stop_codon:yes gene_type:complete